MADCVKQTEPKPQASDPWLDPADDRRLEQIRNSIRRLYEDHRSDPPHPGFTPHGPEHCQAVEELLHRLLPDGLHTELTPYERFLMLASAWLHDIGMIRWLFGSEDRALDAAAVRESHHLRSEEYIVNRPGRCGVEEQDKDVLGLLARAHGIPLSSVRGRRQFRRQTVQIRLVAAYVCLADALHIDSSRVPADAYAICLAYNVPLSSKIHWIKSRFVSGVEIDAKNHRIVLEFKVPTVEQAAKLAQQGVDMRGIGRIHEVVRGEVARNLSAVRPVLIRGDISFFLSVETRTTALLIDEQVLRDLRQIINNPDFMADPSSSRLTHLLLRTVADILHLDDEGKPIGDTDPDLGREQQYRRVLEVLGEIEDRVLAERPCHLGLRNLAVQLRRITEEARQEHGQRMRASGEIGCADDPRDGARADAAGSNRAGGDGGTESRKPGRANGGSEDDPLTRFVRDEITYYQASRRGIRETARHYFLRFLAESRGAPSAPSSRSPQGDGGFVSLADVAASLGPPITVLVYGYSELVTKALCGFRDCVLAALLDQHLTSYPNDPARRRAIPDSFLTAPPTELPPPTAPSMKTILDLIRDQIPQPYHRTPFELLASDHFRILVCTGQPKAQTSSSAQMGYHDGYRYAMALSRRGFSNILMIPDIVVANLLNRGLGCISTFTPIASHGKSPADPDRARSVTEPPAPPGPMVDMVMLGVNGINEVCFRHSSGHLTIALAVGALRGIYGRAKRFEPLPRLVVVTTKRKYQPHEPGALDAEGADAAASADHREPARGGAPRWTYRCQGKSVIDGYLFQNGFHGEPVRRKNFLCGDREMRENLARHGIALYNPLEDRIWNGLLDDLLWEEGYFWGDALGDIKQATRMGDLTLVKDGRAEREDVEQTLAKVIEGWKKGRDKASP